eukprot:360207-Chlamydomonas_euryale.AAC.12
MLALPAALAAAPLLAARVGRVPARRGLRLTLAAARLCRVTLLLQLLALLHRVGGRTCEPYLFFKCTPCGRANVWLWHGLLVMFVICAAP